MLDHKRMAAEELERHNEAVRRQEVAAYEERLRAAARSPAAAPTTPQRRKEDVDYYQRDTRVASEDLERHNEEARSQAAYDERLRTAARTPAAPAATPDRRKESAALAAARDAAGQPQNTGVDYSFSSPPNGHLPRTPVPDTQRQQDEYRRRQQQEEMRQREEEIRRKRDQRQQEQEGIARRQQEADEAARAVRHNLAVNNTGLTVEYTPASLSSTPSMTYSTTTASSSMASTPSSSFYATTPTQPVYTPGLQPSPIPPKPRPASLVDIPPIMPIESPMIRYDGDSTDSEATNGAHDWRRAKQKQAIENSRTPTKAPSRRCVSYTCNLTRRNLTYIFYTLVIDWHHRVARHILLQ